MTTLTEPTTTELSVLALIDAARQRVAERPTETAAVVSYVRRRLDEMDLAPWVNRSVAQVGELAAELTHQLLREITNAAALETQVAALSAPELISTDVPPGLGRALESGFITAILVTAAVAAWESLR